MTGGGHRDESPRSAAADLYRAVAMTMVVLGHWLVSSVSYRDGRFGNDYPLAVLPWTQWLTLAFQVVPVFFLVGGYASAAGWTRWREAGGGQAQDWVRHRIGALLGPTVAYVVVATAAVSLLHIAGLDDAGLATAGWAVAMQLWFLPVYVLVVAGTPLAVAAHRRWGCWAVVVLVAAVVIVDVSAHEVPAAGAANYVLCWATVYQLGVHWRLRGARGRGWPLLALGGTAAVAALVGSGAYPVSMVGAPGAAEQNDFPPTTALMAFCLAQSALLVAVSPVVDGWVTKRGRRVLRAANRLTMPAYLWHMLPVVAVALVGYPTGLLPQPVIGTASWWGWRAAWVALLLVVTAAELTVVRAARPVLGRALPIRTGFRPGLTMATLICGIAAAVTGLTPIAVRGVAPGGGIPVLAVSLLLVAVVAMWPAPARTRVTDRAEPSRPPAPGRV